MVLNSPTASAQRAALSMAAECTGPPRPTYTSDRFPSSPRPENHPRPYLPHQPPLPSPRSARVVCLHRWRSLDIRYAPSQVLLANVANLISVAPPPCLGPLAELRFTNLERRMGAEIVTDRVRASRLDRF